MTAVVIGARRVEIHAAARARPAEFARFDPERLRFHLGTSLADMQVPVQIAPDAVAIIRGAAAEIGLLLATHHKGLVPPDELDRLYLREDYASLPAVSDTLGPSGGGPDLRAAAQLAVAAHPALKGALVCAWMGPGGRGRSLTALWIEALRRGFAEMAATSGREETPLIVALALFAATQEASAELGEVLPGPPLDRYLRAAALSGLWVAARTGLGRAWRDAGRRPDDPLLAKLEAVLSPGALLGGRSQILAGGSTLYGCELAAGIPRADDIASRLAAGADSGAALADIGSALAADDELSRRAEFAAALARLRERVVAAVASAEAAGQGRAVAPLRDLHCAPGGLAAEMSGEGRKALARQIADVASALPPGEAAAALEGVARAVKGWKPGDPGAAMGASRAAARGEYANAAVALLCDAAVERILGPARRAVVARRGDEAEGGAEAEYEAGQLYRISARGAAILRSATERKLGHLFIDVKDFTRRTALLGQAAMAEFLRREFYTPILVAAKRHYSGMQHLADRGGVAVNNLLGDAISISGEIEAMVSLAREVRRLLEAYGARLAREVSSEAVARQIAAMDAVLAARLELAKSPEEAAAVRAERARALARAGGEGLEAGIFISHGPPPLVVTIDDDAFGMSRVAIADKINESARGTARAEAGRARADALLAAERTARGSPELRHAWSVFIGHPLAIPLGPGEEQAALRAARAGDMPGAMRAVAAPVRAALERAVRPGGEPAGEMYNCGAALSGEALEAFLEAVGGRRVVRRVELAPAEIPEELKARWWFGADPQKVIACFEPNARLAELFRYVGKAAFKGLAEVPVWELCSDGAGPGALAGALGASWFRRGA